MLVLTRKQDEKVVLKWNGVEVVLTVAAIAGAKVRLGVDAPSEIDIQRHEVWSRQGEFAEPAGRVLAPVAD